MPEKRTVLQDTQDWLLELQTLRDNALRRHDLILAEELQAEIAEVMAHFDGIRASVN